MKIIEILNMVKRMRSECELDNKEALVLFNEIDKKVYEDVISTHDMPEVKYRHDSVDEEAVIPDEHAGVYILRIFTHFDLIRSETRRYENDMIAYNAAWDNYYNYCNRKYMPKQGAKIRL